MKETGIIMSGNHPKLILDGIKTQTRRVIRYQPPPYCDAVEQLKNGRWNFYKQSDPDFHAYLKRGCPYGQVGDRLWVRETWRVGQEYDALSPSGLWNHPQAYYKEPISYLFGVPVYDADTKWRPSIFMPRWASRIVLEITEVRVERVQEIIPEDCLAEGVTLPYRVFGDGDSDYFESIGRDYVRRFSLLWDSLNAKRGFDWNSNPWVWCISFRRLI